MAIIAVIAAISRMHMFWFWEGILIPGGRPWLRRRRGTRKAMVPWWESTLNGLTLAAAAAFTLVSISHIAAMLFLRKEFAIALR